VFKRYGKQQRCTSLKTNAKTLIWVADKKQPNVDYAGLADRLAGMVSLYKISKQLNLKFKINFTSPLQLTHFLQPNEYNWIIDEEDVYYHPKTSGLVKLSAVVSYQLDFLIGTEAANKSKKNLYDIVQYFCKKKYSQILCYTSIAFADNEYATLANELFKPTPELQNLIDENLRNIGSDYIGVTLRFAQLLGDLRDDGMRPPLDAAAQQKLIARCLEHVKEIQASNPYKKMLITSDSTTFLNEVKELPFVYVIPGKVGHTDYAENNAKEVYTTTFLQYFLLSNAKKVHLIIDDAMYNSGFCYRAALHNNVPYEIRQYVIH
jgi:hypothetical protein